VCSPVRGGERGRDLGDVRGEGCRNKFQEGGKVGDWEEKRKRRFVEERSGRFGGGRLGYCLSSKTAGGGGRGWSKNR